MTGVEVKSTKELLTFRLADQEFALDIMVVREIRGWTHATPLPHAAEFMEGVINLRGTVLPVMNLSARLGMAKCSKSQRNVVIVVRHSDVMTGLRVDAVSDIITVSTDELHAPPGGCANGDASVISALTVIDDRMIRILDLPATVSHNKRRAA